MAIYYSGKVSHLPGSASSSPWRWCLTSFPLKLLLMSLISHHMRHSHLSIICPVRQWHHEQWGKKKIKVLCPVLDFCWWMWITESNMCWEPHVQSQIQRCFRYQFGVFWHRFGVFCHQFDARSACSFAAFVQPQVWRVVVDVPLFTLLKCRWGECPQRAWGGPLETADSSDSHKSSSLP